MVTLAFCWAAGAGEDVREVPGVLDAEAEAELVCGTIKWLAVDGEGIAGGDGE